MARDELCLEVQPLWRFGDHEAIGVEALVRWNHPTRGRLLPAEVLPVAERSDLILAVGEVVLTRACEQIAAWQQELLAAYRLRADRLGFDLAIRAVDDDQARRTVDALHRLGTRLAWDDVGTGSSLSDLRRCPWDGVKRNGSLVASAVDHVEGAAMIRAVRTVAHDLGCDLGQGNHLGRPVPADQLRVSRAEEVVAARGDGAAGP